MIQINEFLIISSVNPKCMSFVPRILNQIVYCHHVTAGCIEVAQDSLNVSQHIFQETFEYLELKWCYQIQ